MSPSAAAPIAFAVTSNPAATAPVAWNTLCRTARRLAAEGYEIRIGAGPGGEQIVAEHALTAGGRVTLVLPQPGYEDAWVGQIRKWFPGRVTVEQDEPGIDGGCITPVAGSAFLIVLGVEPHHGRASGAGRSVATMAPPACDRSVTMAIQRAEQWGIAVYDLREELPSSWLEEAVETAASESEPVLALRSKGLDNADMQIPTQRPANCGSRTRRAAPSLLRRAAGSRRPGSPGPRFAG